MQMAAAAQGVADSHWGEPQKFAWQSLSCDGRGWQPQCLVCFQLWACGTLLPEEGCQLRVLAAWCLHHSACLTVCQDGLCLPELDATVAEDPTRPWGWLIWALAVRWVHSALCLWPALSGGGWLQTPLCWAAGLHEACLDLECESLCFERWPAGCWMSWPESAAAAWSWAAGLRLGAGASHCQAPA